MLPHWLWLIVVVFFDQSAVGFAEHFLVNLLSGLNSSILSKELADGSVQAQGPDLSSFDDVLGETFPHSMRLSVGAFWVLAHPVRNNQHPQLIANNFILADSQQEVDDYFMLFLVLERQPLPSVKPERIYGIKCQKFGWTLSM